MHLLRGTLTVAMHVGAITTTVAAQSTASPAPTTERSQRQSIRLQEDGSGWEVVLPCRDPRPNGPRLRGSASRLAEVVERGESLEARRWWRQLERTPLSQVANLRSILPAIRAADQQLGDV